jgi:hypothetical protein
MAVFKSRISGRDLGIRVRGGFVIMVFCVELAFVMEGWN